MTPLLYLEIALWVLLLGFTGEHGGSSFHLLRPRLLSQASVLMQCVACRHAHIEPQLRRRSPNQPEQEGSQVANYALPPTAPLIQLDACLSACLHALSLMQSMPLWLCIAPRSAMPAGPTTPVHTTQTSFRWSAETRVAPVS